ncbi:acyltransferase family protein [Lactobacillus sp. Marseille-P7033]|nr:acyltransferase family protein [Lactobacillus sp. Marseille-P7033]NGC77329.1 acyltransferase family protein [Limosilactobacillus reuteri]
MERNYGLDVVRIIAIFFVVMNHVYESAYNLSGVGPHILSSQQLWSGYLGFTIGRVGVPLFLMLTGYFLLARTWTFQKV